MLASIVYMILCAVASGLLASLLVMVRPVKDRDETKPWRTFAICYILVLLAPYGYIEVITRMYGKEMEGAVAKAYSAAKFNGPMKYYRVVSYKEQSAKLYVVGTDSGEWGSDSPVVSVKLKKVRDHWAAESYEVMAASRLNADRIVLPPFF